MVYLFLLLIFFSGVFADEDVEVKLNKMLGDYVYSNFRDYDVISILPVAKSYIKTLMGKDFDDVNCKSKGNSGMYLYLDCQFLENGKPVSSFPVTVRIKDKGNETVRKDQKITIIYTSKNIKIGLLGVAMNSGKVGDVIEVKNISTGKVLKARVLSNTEVLVED